MIQDVTDVHHVRLPSQALVRGVNAQPAAVAAESGVRIDAELVVRTGTLQLCQWHELLRRAMKEKHVQEAVDVVRVGPRW
jgi:hypothetical protein